MISTKKNSYTTNVSPESRLSETQDASDIFSNPILANFLSHAGAENSYMKNWLSQENRRTKGSAQKWGRRLRSSELNMVYDVILTDFAKAQLDQIIHYLLYEIGSSQAARNVLEDAENTKIRLSHLAGSLKLCEDSRLRLLGPP